MPYSAVCQYDYDQVKLAIRVRARKYLEKMAEEQGMVSSSGDLIHQMWDILESQTSSALNWVRKCYPASSSRQDFRVHERDYGPFTSSESASPLELDLEREVELRVVPPEHAWKLLRTKLVMVQQFPLDLEP